MADLKPENQRKVIHVANLESNILGTLGEIETEFWRNRTNHQISKAVQHSATYLFETIDDAQYFGQLLDKRDIAYSYHPAKDYSKVATQDMDDFARAIHNAFR